MTPPPDRLPTWKEQPPQTPDEAEAARHLQSLRSAPSLAPEALARVERRLREKVAHREPRRLDLFAGLRPAVLSGALALLLVVGGLTFMVAEHSRPSLQSAGTLALAPSQPSAALEQDRTQTKSLGNFGSPASKPAPAPTTMPPSALAMREWTQPPPDVDKEERRREPAIQTLGGLGSLKGAEETAPEPAHYHGAAKAKKAARGFDELEKSDDGLGAVASASAGASALSGAGGGGAVADLRAQSEVREAPAGLARAAAAPAAAAPAPPPAAMASGRLEASGAAAADTAAFGATPMKPETPIAVAERLAHTGRCPEAVASFSALLEGGDSALPVIERALMGRARCRLQLGRQADAQADLQLYLSRFPNGRFAAEARSRLK